MSIDPTKKYLLMIVGIVAIVGLVYLVSLPSGTTSGSKSSDVITGNVVLEDYSTQTDTTGFEYTDYSGVFRTFLGLTLIGACVFMYHKF